MDLEKRVIIRASELFVLRGIRVVTMDDVAMETGISKRTLYEIFKDKDGLLLKTVQHQEQVMAQEADELAKSCSNSFELNLKLYEKTLNRLRRVNPNYISDLQRYHPKVYTIYEKKKEENMRDNTRLTEQGMKEGYVRTELNSEILTLLLHTQLEVMASTGVFNGKFTFAEVFETIVMNFARGVATPKGLALLEKYIR